MPFAGIGEIVFWKKEYAKEQERVETNPFPDFCMLFTEEKIPEWTELNSSSAWGWLTNEKDGLLFSVSGLKLFVEDSWKGCAYPLPDTTKPATNNNIMNRLFNFAKIRFLKTETYCCLERKTIRMAGVFI